MFDDAFLNELKGELLKVEGDFREVYLKRTAGVVVSREQDCGTAEAAHDCGIGVRIRKNGEWSFSHLTTDDPGKMLSFVKSLASGEKPQDPGSVKICGAGEEEPEGCVEIKALLAETAARMKEGGASFFLGLLKTGMEEVSIITGDGNIVSGSKSRTTFYAQSAVLEDGRAAKGAECAMEASSLSKIPIREFVMPVALESLRLSRIHLGAKHSPEGEVESVLSSRAAGMLVHEAVGHLFEADFREGGAEGLLGNYIASNRFTLLEKGPEPEFASFDDEGNSPSARPLIEEGRAVNLLTDVRSSLELELPVTGNGRRENHRFAPMPRVWKLDSPAGKGSDEELCSGITIGLYIKRLSDGKVDLKSGEAFFPVAEGYLVRDGKISESVTNAGISVGLPDFLMNIVAVGGEKEQAAGLCVKKSQAVWTSESIPSLRLSKLLVRRLTA